MRRSRPFLGRGRGYQGFLKTALLGKTIVFPASLLNPSLKPGAVFGSLAGAGSQDLGPSAPPCPSIPAIWGLCAPVSPCHGDSSVVLKDAARQTPKPCAPKHPHGCSPCVSCFPKFHLISLFPREISRFWAIRDTAC